MKKPKDEDISLWQDLTKDIQKINHDTFQSPLTYKKERPQNRDFQYDFEVRKNLSTVKLNKSEFDRYTIDQTLDLHGLTLNSAIHLLQKTLYKAQMKNYKMLLIITGKGKITHIENGDSLEVPGVLRREIPKWLDQNPGLVIGYNSASARDGGSGALYVRIRRLR